MTKSFSTSGNRQYPSIKYDELAKELLPLLQGIKILSEEEIDQMVDERYNTFYGAGAKMAYRKGLIDMQNKQLCKT